VSKNYTSEWEIDKLTRKSCMRTYRLMNPYYMFLLFMVTVFSFKAFTETDHRFHQSGAFTPKDQLYKAFSIKKDIRIKVNTPYYHIDDVVVE